MSRFNLLEEAWIPAVRKKDGIEEELSLTELLRHAKDYQELAGETEIQNFAILRLLLAVLQTVFSRYDSEGKAIVPVDDRMVQTEKIEDDEEEQYEYEEKLNRTWKSIWGRNAFPEILFQYLDLWHDRFFLFDEQYPFYQVTKDTMNAIMPEGKHATAIAGRFLNKSISESGNKTALFSPKAEGSTRQNKDVLSAPELVRWMITFQGYAGLSDKTSIAGKNQRNSKGWLFDLGGIYLAGNDLFETLMLNEIPVHPEERYRYEIQKPCWEFSGEDIIDRLKKETPITNLAELYTNWSKAMYLRQDQVLPGPAFVEVIKLPEIQHTDQFLEPMTVWNLNKSGENKGHFTPKKHPAERAMWRSFGLFALPSAASQRKRPGIQTHLVRIRGILGDRLVTVHSVSMQDDGNATSWMPSDEITDAMRLNDIVFTDEQDAGWLVRIADVVEDTKDVIDRIYRNYLRDLAEIRNLGTGTSAFLSGSTENFYQEVDEPFRRWLLTIRPESPKEEKVLEWKKELKRTAIRMAETFVRQAGMRDYTGIEKGDGIKNIATAYLSFRMNLNQKLGKEIT